MNKKSFSLITAVAISASVLFTGGSFAHAQGGKFTPTDYTENQMGHGSPPIDLAIVNDEKVIEMLQRTGKIQTNATQEQKQKILQDYLGKLQKETPVDNGALSKEQAKLQNQITAKQRANGILDPKGNKFNLLDKVFPPVQEEKWDKGTKESKVLILLVEFPDFPHNSIKPGESEMYYPDYTKQHYQDMVFGKDGYTGPNGENLVSMKQFYEKQSGGSYTVSGTVSGWYKAAQPAAYYGAHTPTGGNDIRARNLVAEALRAAGQDPTLNLADYDKEDRYDLDGDSNYNEPDGIIDHLMVVHSAVGEEAGGGQLGPNAIWSHRWNLGGLYPIPGTNFKAYDYTIEPADGAAGVFAHEYGHDLGLPDEYDTQYSGQGEAIGYWSVMSGGSWAGKIPGTEPTGFSPYAREYLQNSMTGSNWLKGSQIDLKDIPSTGIGALIDQANSKGTNNDAIRINLPKKEININNPASGKFSYYSGKADNLKTKMTTALDLTSATTANLAFKTWYKIEKDYDYASIQVSTDGGKTFATVAGNVTTKENPYESNPGDGITGSSTGWVDATFDLSAYVGKKIILSANYVTDAGTTEQGFYVDDLKVTTDKGVIFEDGAETPKFTLSGFTQTTGTDLYDQYYLVEWRNHQGVDAGLSHIKRANSNLTYDPGLVIWYVDTSFSDNWTGIHPGDGFLGVVDADQKGIFWSDKTVASNRYQLHDAAFSSKKSLNTFLDYSKLTGLTLTDNNTTQSVLFDDSKDYSNPALVDSGRKVPKLGLKILVTAESPDRSVARVQILKGK